jgi:hypothetical protein
MLRSSLHRLLHVCAMLAICVGLLCSSGCVYWIAKPDAPTKEVPTPPLPRNAPTTLYVVLFTFVGIVALCVLVALFTPAPPQSDGTKKYDPFNERRPIAVMLAAGATLVVLLLVG